MNFKHDETNPRRKRFGGKVARTYEVYETNEKGYGARRVEDENWKLLESFPA